MSRISRFQITSSIATLAALRSTKSLTVTFARSSLTTRMTAINKKKSLIWTSALNAVTGRISSVQERHLKYLKKLVTSLRIQFSNHYSSLSKESTDVWSAYCKISLWIFWSRKLVNLTRIFTTWFKDRNCWDNLCRLVSRSTFLYLILYLSLSECT